ncbi:MAG: acyl-CoA dehydrogenase family protein [Proteobacteria bacterium]|nr:acyl-CoA dehydrogenase family protein [Pseudomonadota bacterium]
MDFSLTKEQTEICRLIREASRKGLNESVFEDDEKSIFPMHKWRVCGDIGIHGLPVPGEYGGSGLDMLSTALAIQNLSRTCKDEGLIFSIVAHICTVAVPLMNHGTDDQKRKYLPKIAKGEYIGGNAITESSAGSDPTGMLTTVSKTDTAYTIEGAKIFVTNAPVSDLLIVYARHPKGMKMLDISAFIVEKGNPGLQIGQVFHKMGLRTSSMSEIVLSDCRVSPEALLGRERWGMTVFNVSMFWERIIMSAYHIGAMAQQYEMALAYANSRKQFGQNIGQFSAVSDKLIDMKMRIETSKLLLYKTCWTYDKTGDINMADASMVKLYVSDVRVKSSLDAVQLFGAYGYMKESDVEKQLRDSIASKIYSGTSEIQKKIIAENLGRKND